MGLDSQRDRLATCPTWLVNGLGVFDTSGAYLMPWWLMRVLWAFSPGKPAAPGVALLIGRAVLNSGVVGWRLETGRRWDDLESRPTVLVNGIVDWAIASILCPLLAGEWR
jgi:hypothetical protein